MSGPSFYPSAVVWQTPDGQYEYDAWPTKGHADRHLPRYAASKLIGEIRGYWMCRTVLAMDVTPGLVLLTAHGELLRVSSIRQNTGGTVTIRGAVWECGRLDGWCAGPRHEFDAQRLAVYPVMPDPDQEVTAESILDEVLNESPTTTKEPATHD